MSRRSVRRFSDKDVSDNAIEKLIDAGRWAPSAGNQQPLRIIVVRNKRSKERLNEATGNQKFFIKAPVLLIILSDKESTVNRYSDRGDTLYQYQDTAASIQNILLQVVELGLVSCWIGAFNDEKVREIFHIPSNVRPVAILPIAYPHEDGKVLESSRLDREKIVFAEKYGKYYF